jgi:hypothetical protein
MRGIGMTAVMVPVARQALDAMQQRLFAVALGLRTLRARVADDDLALEIERLETEVDGLIRTLRSQASRPIRRTEG